MIRSAFLFVLCVFGLFGEAEACDFIFRKKPTLADFPPEISVARVRVLQVQQLDERYKKASLQRIEALRGDVPENFGAIGDAVSDCGFTFPEGKELLIGLVRRNDMGQDSFYADKADTLTQAWVEMFYADR